MLHDQKENEKSYWGEIKTIFTIFKELSFAKNCLRPGITPLTNNAKPESFWNQILHEQSKSKLMYPDKIKKQWVDFSLSDY